MDATQPSEGKKSNLIQKLIYYIFGDNIKTELQRQLAYYILSNISQNGKVYTKDILQKAKELTKGSGLKCYWNVIKKLTEWSLINKSKDKNGFYYELDIYAFRKFLKDLYKIAVKIKR